VSYKFYSNNNYKKGLKEHLKQMFIDLSSSRDLARRITIRDFKGQFRQSALGVIWAFITPLMSTVVWIVLENTGVIRLKSTEIPYAAYVFSGTMLWSVFSESVFAPLQSTQQARGIMGKINFPKEALLLSGLYKTLGNGLIRVCLVWIAFVVMGIMPSYNFLLLPVFFFGIVLVGFSFGIILTPLGMLFNDVGRTIPLLLQALMYLSPVVYAVPTNTLFSKLMSINPVTPLIINFRNCFSGESFSDLGYYFAVQVASIILLFIGWAFYRFSIPIIVERSGS
jgi:lipopolysaccharide transport system permease protein